MSDTLKYEMDLYINNHFKNVSEYKFFVIHHGNTIHIIINFKSGLSIQFDVTILEIVDFSIQNPII